MMIAIAHEISTELTDKQFNVLIAASLARQFDEAENEDAGYRSIKWLKQGRRNVETDVLSLIQAGLLEVRKAVLNSEEQYFRITAAGLMLVSEF